MDDVKALIRDVPDFPKPGIVYKDISPVLQDPAAFNAVLDALEIRARAAGAESIVGVESRGFIFGAPLAARLGLPFVLARKPGKLPAKTYAVEYELEYGTDRLEMHVDALQAGTAVVIVDDLLATGGTAEAACLLVEAADAKVVGVFVVIELTFLGGAARLEPRPVQSLVRY
ncbi:MAG: adenine phosphoribosyltransferase [Bradymonadia bacterium]|jgi:adenine phosphoribosyltransferase